MKIQKKKKEKKARKICLLKYHAIHCRKFAIHFSWALVNFNWHPVLLVIPNSSRHYYLGLCQHWFLVKMPWYHDDLFVFFVHSTILYDWNVFYSCGNPHGRSIEWKFVLLFNSHSLANIDAFKFWNQMNNMWAFHGSELTKI